MLDARRTSKMPTPEKLRICNFIIAFCEAVIIVLVDKFIFLFF